MTEAPRPESRPSFTILHADEHVAVVVKDAGLLTVPAHGERCLVHELEAALDRIKFGRHGLKVVHRLDKLTSGVLVFARTPDAARLLAKQFAAHATEREYVAVVIGNLPLEAGTIAHDLDGKHAVTHFEVTARHGHATTIAVRLETGRKNQIRRHVAAEGHPVVGDERVAGDVARHSAWSFPRIALHARLLGFRHPRSGDLLHFEAPVPEEFKVF